MLTGSFLSSPEWITVTIGVCVASEVRDAGRLRKYEAVVFQYVVYGLFHWHKNKGVTPMPLPAIDRLRENRRADARLISVCMRT